MQKAHRTWHQTWHTILFPVPLFGPLYGECAVIDTAPFDNNTPGEAADRQTTSGTLPILEMPPTSLFDDRYSMTAIPRNAQFRDATAETPARPAYGQAIPRRQSTKADTSAASNVPGEARSAQAHSAVPGLPLT